VATRETKTLVDRGPHRPHMHVKAVCVYADEAFIRSMSCHTGQHFLGVHFRSFFIPYKPSTRIQKNSLPGRLAWAALEALLILEKRPADLPTPVDAAAGTGGSGHAWPTKTAGGVGAPRRSPFARGVRLQGGAGGLRAVARGAGGARRPSARGRGGEEEPAVGAAATGEWWCVTRRRMAAARVQALEAAVAWSAARFFWRSGRLPQVAEARWRPPDGVAVGAEVQGPDLGSLGPI
jgi:hypothetical protein